MLSLHELQKKLRQGILNPDDASLAQWIQPSNLSLQNKLDVYSNNHFSSLHEVLKSAYPVVLQLVGEEFFREMARKYIEEYPSQSSDISLYGEKLSHFLAEFIPARSLPYLPDMAKFEWALHEVFYEEKSSALDLQRFRDLKAHQYNEIKLKMNPASRLLAFKHPILKIWQFCQNENNQEQPINLSEEYDKVLVIRREWEITFEKLTEGEFAFLFAFSRNYTFSEACVRALEVESSFDIQFIWQKHIVNNTFVDLYF